MLRTSSSDSRSECEKKRSMIKTLLVLALLAACREPGSLSPIDQITASSPRDPAANFPVLRPVADRLTAEYARYRGGQISQPRYELLLSFSRDGDSYHGAVTIQFDASSAHRDVTIDYHGQEVSSLAVNGSPVHPSYNGEFISIPARYLKEKNTIQVSFNSTFDTSGHGLMRFVDKEDRHVYVHSELEPYAAHHVFPCFDQPDMKASIELTVETPSDWIVLSNSAEQSTQTNGDLRIVQFKPTVPLSPYVFAVMAGPFIGWHRLAGDVPISIYARASQARYVDAPYLLDVTSKGLAYYGQYFGMPYPFGKYDQVFVPELPGYGMENAGLVALGEVAIFKGPVSESERIDRDDTLLHEMAHMWFGNLVTMRWWNDLWLNESFATYMAPLAMQEVLGYSGAWMDFAVRKQRGYQLDDLDTTHPIAVDVVDTDAAVSIFDSITYAKGAASIRQLAETIGDTSFRQGLGKYFKKHQYSNASLVDFMAALQSHTSIDLHRWTEQWIRTAGLNVVQPHWQCTGGRISEFALIQQVSSGAPLLRQHHTRLGLLTKSPNGRLRLNRSLELSYDGERTPVAALVGEQCPALIYTNANDIDYAKVRLDSSSLVQLKQGITQIPDPVLRQQIWSSIWMMARDERFPLLDFLSMAKENLRDEKSERIIEDQLKRVEQSLWVYLPLEQRMARLAEWEDVLMARLQSAVNPTTKLLYAKTFLAVVRSPAGLQRLRSNLGSATNLIGRPIDQELRWQILWTLSAVGEPQIEAMVHRELIRDPSDRGERAAERVLAARPQLTVKAAVWQRIVADTQTSFAVIESMMQGFQTRGQEDLLRPYATRFYEVVPEIYRKRDSHFAKLFTSRLLPASAEPAVVDLGRQFLKRTDLPPQLRRLVREYCQESERTVRIRALQPRMP